MKLKSIFIAGLILLFANALFPLTEDMPKKVDTVLAEIRTDLGLKKSDRIDPDKVSANRLEELGDSVMESILGNHDLHEEMDRRMGGEGSESLKIMHQRMGYQYLSGAPVGWMGGMMRNWSGPANPTNARGGYMMYNWGPYGMMGGFGYFGIVIGGLVLIALGIGLYFIVRAATGMGNKSESALDILNRRYAKGEITKEDYERMKKDIGNG